MPQTARTQKLYRLLVAGLLLNLSPSPIAHAATITVNSTADTVANDGQCTLREAIVAANTATASGGAAGECVAGTGDDTIDLTGIAGTIDLTGPLPDVAGNMIFDGPGDSALTVRRNSGGDYRIFAVAAGATVTLSDLTVSNGSIAGDHGGGIYNAGTLTVRDSAISGNSAYLGGGIFNTGTLTLTHVTVSSNSAEQGGGIDNDAGTMELINTTISDNQATSGGGGIANVGGAAASASLTNSTIRDNSASHGGGLSNDGTMTLDDSTVSGNEASSNGGGLSNDNGGMVELTGSTINGNSTGSNGGGIFNDPNSRVTLTNSTVSDNSTNTTVASHGHGGGLYNAGTLTLANSTVSSNTVTTTANNSYGGGIFNAGTLAINNSLVSNNNTYGNLCHGGGIHNENTLTLNNSTARDNSASATGGNGDGGGIHNTGSGSSATLDNSTVNGNSSSGGGSGGGLWNSHGAHMELTNSTVSGNTASGNGGGINNSDSGTLALNNSTVSDSNANDRGGGIWNDNNGTINLKNSLIAGNTAFVAGNDCYNTAALISLDYNLLGNDNGCNLIPQPNDRVNVAPHLDPLQDNGGPTETHALRVGSPAFDAIPRASCTDRLGATIATDQRGIPRPQGAACDIGAYEAQTADLSLSKRVNQASPAEGETIAFTIQVTNNGLLEATGVVISDSLPLSLTCASSNASQGNYVDGTGEWNVGQLAAGLRVTLTLTATVDADTAGTTITNTAVVAAVEQFDPDANNIALATITVAELTPGEHQVHLPLVVRNYVPPVTFPLHIGNAIPVRAVAYQGETFYTHSVQIPGKLSSGGHFYLSSQRDTAVAALVDDELAILLDSVEILTYDFSTSGAPEPAIIEVPQTTMEQLAGRTVTIEYRDVYGKVVKASAMWLIWLP